MRIYIENDPNPSKNIEAIYQVELSKGKQTDDIVLV